MSLDTSSTRCEFCGANVTSLTAFGSRFCDGCKEKYSQYLCVRCEKLCTRLGDLPSRLICGKCSLHEKLSNIKEDDLKQIVALLRDNQELKASRYIGDLLQIKPGEAAFIRQTIKEQM